jgi:hypothetical protein
MNPLRYWILASALCSSLAFSAPAVDDPPPEPIDCPLCGGDPAVHARRMFDVVRVGGGVVTHSLRW